MRSRIRFVLLILSLTRFDPVGTQAQTDSLPVRVELEARPTIEPYHLIPLGERGFILFTQTNEFQDRNNRIWLVSHFDTDLKETWTKPVTVPRTLSIKGQSSLQSLATVMFYDEKQGQGNNFCLIIATPDSAEIKKLVAAREYRSEIRIYQHFGAWVYVGMVGKSASAAFRVNVYDFTIQPIRLRGDAYGFIENICIDGDRGGFAVLSSDRNTKPRTPLYLYLFDEKASETYFGQILKADNKKAITSAEFIRINDTKWMVAGGFTGEAPRKLSAGDSPDLIRSSGFYQLISSDSDYPSVFYHYFSSFRNIDEYIRGPVAQSLHKRIKRQQMQGRVAPMAYTISMHPVKYGPGEFLLGAEAFIPDYRTVTNVIYDYYGRPIPRSYSVFDGYRYSHAVIASVNANGQLLWTNGLEMMNVRSFNLENKVMLAKAENSYVLAFSFDGKIAWKEVGPGLAPTNIAYTTIELPDQKDRLTSEQSSSILQWYDKYFLASGYQTILNNNHPTLPRRTVFYINKLAFD